MRPDMRHVVRNLARGGSFYRNRGTAMKVDLRGVSISSLDEDDLDFGLNRMPMSIYNLRCGTSYGVKSVGLRTAPLRRFLRSQVGQSWNMVHAMFRRQFDYRSPKNIAVINSFEGMVEANCFVGANGVIYTRWWGYLTEPSGFYVDPTTGLLCENTKTSDKQRDPRGQRFKRRQEVRELLKSAGLSSLPVESVRMVDSTTVLYNKDGIWFIYYLKPYTSEDKIEVDRFVEITDDEGLTQSVWRKFWIPYSPEPGRLSVRVVALHQMCKKLLKKYRHFIAGNPY